MAKYIAVHALPQPATPEEITPLLQELLRHETVDAYWVQSWAETNEQGKALRIFCEWNAKSEDAVQRVFERAPAFPLDRVRPMVRFDSDGFRMPAREHQVPVPWGCASSGRRAMRRSHREV